MGIQISTWGALDHASGMMSYTSYVLILNCVCVCVCECMCASSVASYGLDFAFACNVNCVFFSCDHICHLVTTTVSH